MTFAPAFPNSVNVSFVEGPSHFLRKNDFDKKLKRNALILFYR